MLQFQQPRGALEGVGELAVGIVVVVVMVSVRLGCVGGWGYRSVVRLGSPVPNRPRLGWGGLGGWAPIRLHQGCRRPRCRGRGEQGAMACDARVCLRAALCG